MPNSADAQKMLDDAIKTGTINQVDVEKAKAYIAANQKIETDPNNFGNIGIYQNPPTFNWDQASKQATIVIGDQAFIGTSAGTGDVLAFNQCMWGVSTVLFGK